MRWRPVALVALGVNIVLAAGWLVSSRQSGTRSSSGTTGLESGAAPGKTNVIVRRQFFSWHQVESPDYPTYITNLRDIGCPEQTIRDIIIADVNALYARKRATDLVTPDQQWWRSEPDTNIVQVAAEKAKALDEERRTLLARLLGPNWESGDLLNLPRPSRPAIALDGPVLGALSTETKQALQEINIRSQERMQAYLDAQKQAGRNPDPVELARLRQQTRDDLARVLPPAQLEEFLLRYSQYANNLRTEFGQLQYFNATPEEFRAIFRSTDGLDQRIELLAEATDPNSVQARQSLLEQRENALRVALGVRRYQEYRLLHDPLYRDAVATAQQAGTPESVMTIYQINLAAAAEQQTIANDPGLTDEQKNIALKSLQLDQLKANTVASGQDLPPEPPPLPPTPPRRTYTLRPGDTPAVIATIYGVPESALRAVNPNVNLNRLKPGDSINIPRSAPTPIGAPRLSPYSPVVPSGP
ncbi:MAG TPA: LysM domain-containing protein [Candidatus Sulfotelmatobacter sp.]|nr:LysM domain-containing protein [Candidatus Sulfotelmatobacter sp.]